MTYSLDRRPGQEGHVCPSTVIIYESVRCVLDHKLGVRSIKKKEILTDPLRDEIPLLILYMILSVM